MSNRIITISREFGSGGRTIGKEVAAKLGIHCYDSELIEKIAQESGLAKEFIAEKGEYASHGGWLANAFSYGSSYNGTSVQDYLWKVQREIILELAEKESCVIVGRCADYILRDHDNCLKVFIHAASDKRAERIVKIYGETMAAPEKRLQDKDMKRKAYYHFYTNMEWGEIQNYHITLDSGELGIDKCVDIITDLYQMRDDSRCRR